MVLLVSACGTDKASEIGLNPSNGLVNLSDDVPGVWDEVCVLSPYTNNEIAREVIGTYHDVESESDIWSDDSIALLVTLEQGKVVGLFEVGRGEVDIAPLGGNCYPRDKSDISLAI